MSITQTHLSPLAEVLKNEWKNGWKARCEKERKKATFQKAIHLSAKEHAKFGNVSSEFKRLVEEFIDLGASRSFTLKILKILDAKCENTADMEPTIFQILGETQQKVEQIISLDSHSLTKEELVSLWNEKGLSQQVLEESKKFPIRKAFLRVFKAYLEKHYPHCTLTKDLYSGIDSNLTRFFKRLQDILGTQKVASEEVIRALSTDPNVDISGYFTYKAKPMTFKK